MAYLSNDLIESVREIDLLSYLETNEPWNLVHISGDNYCTKEHDSLKISNGKWYWFSRGIGGYSALDYLMKVQDIPLREAVEMIIGPKAKIQPFIPRIVKKKENRKLLIPELANFPYQAKNYLISRGIDPDIIDYCIKNSILFETEKYHNAVFVGYDTDGIARYASMRGTTSKYKSEVTGSNKHFSFFITAGSESDHLHLFEAAIDLLSYATLLKMGGKDWRKDNLLSLAGVFKTKRENVVPVALSQYLKDHPGITTIHLHLDNDDVGRGASLGIMGGLKGKYTLLDEPPARGFKDVNDQLMHVLKVKSKEEYER